MIVAETESEGEGALQTIVKLMSRKLSPPHPVMEEVAAAPPADEEDMGSRSNKKPSSRALNTKKEKKGMLTEGIHF